jgi:hypothetical protein
MRFDGPMREIEPLTDLAIRQPVGGHLCDLKLLWGELVPCVGRAPGGALTGRPQLLARTLTPRCDPKRIERIPRRAQRRTRVRNPPLSTEPLPKSQQQTCTVKRRAGHVGGEGVTEQRLGVFLGCKEWTRVQQANVEPATHS